MSTTTSSPEGDEAMSVLKAVSASAISGGLFALPAFILVVLFAPNVAGFYLIGAAAVILHISLISLDSNQEEVEIDTDSMNKTEKRTFVGLMFLALVVGLGVRLVLASGAAVLTLSFTGAPELAIAIAAGFPILERKAADIIPKATPSMIVTLASLWVIIKLLQLVSSFHSASAEKITENTRRIGPV